ncbi:RNA polymerase sigma factor RpoE [Minicystis rosea]|nr:RNA polymerase sigma factor RpoE [Minicystis rosea]
MWTVTSASAPSAAPTTPGAPTVSMIHSEAPSFEAVYDECFDLVFRNIRRLGVPDAAVDDAVQEVFLVVHRRLGEFEGRASLRTWVFSIVARVAKDHRRSLRRKSPHTRAPDASVDADTVPDERGGDPHTSTERSEGVRLLHRVLDALDDDKREVLVMAELEQLTAPEIAEVLGENVNTIYARLRAARRDFEQAAQRERARDAWRLR